MSTKINPRTKRVLKTLSLVKPIKQKLSKSQILTNVAAAGGVDKKTAAAMMNQLANMIVGSIKPKSCGKFSFPGIVNITTKKTKAKPRRQVVNRFTGETVWAKAKPAGVRVVARVTPVMKQVAAH